MPDFSNQTKGSMDDKGWCGMEVSIGNNVVCMPFPNGGAVTFVVTVNRNKVSVDAGSITSDSILLDYYHSELNVGEEICVSLRNLDFVSLPLRKRSFSNHV